MPVTLYGIIMKKTFNLTHPKIKVPRLFEAIKNEESSDAHQKL